MKGLVLSFTLTALLTINAVAQTHPKEESDKNDSISCRSAVVLAYASFGEKISEDDFSSSTFDELNITVEQFNILSSTEQDEIYKKVKPIEVMVQETIDTLNRYVNRYVGTFYEMYMLDELESWRSSRDGLRGCVKTKTAN